MGVLQVEALLRTSSPLLLAAATCCKNTKSTLCNFLLQITKQWYCMQKAYYLALMLPNKRDRHSFFALTDRT